MHASYLANISKPSNGSNVQSSSSLPSSSSSPNSQMMVHFYIEEGIVSCPWCGVDLGTFTPIINSEHTSCSTIMTRNQTFQVVWILECSECNRVFKLNVGQRSTHKLVSNPSSSSSDSSSSFSY
ncbi:hypothetical protein FDP41_000370 [Naegleria fowleri]|uniref:Uncharacterized protein n=1 Tax=Naegleria fowleri TaxID=5763 RepID=A0A6A5CB29_NAEFO|nr:uncharacterized protein FDP41_000370 [Naegleria fowleri]KAF0984471.1 hypothetical protein FDP41_000370 [Naegleria fowleri]CAG4714885.1 unnamed protein product [Naegleria fowleri]